jgi:hypothetical protein
VASLVAVVVLCRGPFGGALEAAHAQNADPQRKAAAEALFEEGKSLLAQGNYAAACQRLEQSQDTDPGVGTLLWLGECYARLGKVASAWAIFREATSAARQSGQAERARMADERARELRPLLSQLTLMVAPEPPRGFELMLDGQVVFAGLYGVPFPVDAGTHQLVARAPGFEVWTGVVQVQGDAARQAVQIPALTPASVMVPPTVAPVPAAWTEAGSVANTDSAESHPGASQRTLAYWVGGGGVVALGVGVVFGLKASSKNSEAEDKYCVEGQACFDPRGEELNSSARNWALGANVFYGVGVAALATAAVLYFTADSDKRTSTPRLQLTPLVGDVSGLNLTGEF